MNTLDSRTRGTLVLFAVAVGSLLAALFISFRFGVELFWLLAAIAVMPVAWFLMRKQPIVILTCLLFVGNFKTVAAQGISFTDPTMILLLLAGGAIFIEALSTFSGDSEWSLQEAFRGQAAGVSCFLIFVAVVSLSYLYTVAPNYGWVKLSRFLSFKPLVFFAPLVLFKRERDVRQFVVMFFVLGLALTAKDIYAFAHPTEGILSGAVDTTHIGDAQLIGMTLLTLFFSSYFQKFPKILGLAVVLFLALGLVATTARGPLLSVLVVLITYSFIARTIRTISFRHIMAGLLLLSAAIIPALSWVERYPAVQERVFEKEQQLVAFFHGERDPGGTTEQRLEFYRSAARAFAERPLTGWGVGGWPVFFYGTDKEDYPHNLILEIAAEQGFLGLVAFSALLVALLKAMRRIWAQRPDLAFPIPLFSYGLLTLMFSGDLNTRSFWLMSGTLLALSRMCQLQASQLRYRIPILLLPESAAECSQAA